MELQLLGRVLLYYCIVLLGLMISIATGTTQARMHGCPLYGRATGSPAMFLVWPGQRSNCEFITYFHLLFGILVGALLAALHTYALVVSIRSLPLHWLGQTLAKLVLLVMHGLLAFISLVSACVLTVGLANFCRSVVTIGFSHCSDMQASKWIGIDGSMFYSSLALATGACWICFFCWVGETVLLVVSILKKDSPRDTR